MFSVAQKREIAEKVQKILRETNHPELPTGEIRFLLHVEGAESWSWADIQNNGAVQKPDVNPWNEAQDSQPQVIMSSLLSIQACVPKDWFDEQIKEFAERRMPCGTTGGWQIRKQGSPRLAGCDERVACEAREGYVHVILDA